MVMYLRPTVIMITTTMSSTLGVFLVRQVAAFSSAMSPVKTNHRISTAAPVAVRLRHTVNRLHQVGHQRVRGRLSSSSAGAQAPAALQTAVAGQDPPMFDFETVHNRSGTGALKWDKYLGKDVIPMWVADMELPTAPVILDALRARIQHGIFGYTYPTPGVQDAVMRYYKARAVHDVCSCSLSTVVA